jgi:hypothetical protein
LFDNFIGKDKSTRSLIHAENIDKSMSGDFYSRLPNGMQRGQSAPKGEEYESIKIAEYL